MAARNPLKEAARQCGLQLDDRGRVVLPCGGIVQAMESGEYVAITCPLPRMIQRLGVRLWQRRDVGVCLVVAERMLPRMLAAVCEWDGRDEE